MINLRLREKIMVIIGNGCAGAGRHQSPARKWVSWKIHLLTDSRYPVFQPDADHLLRVGVKLALTRFSLMEGARNFIWSMGWRRMLNHRDSPRRRTRKWYIPNLDWNLDTISGWSLLALLRFCPRLKACGLGRLGLYNENRGRCNSS